MIFKIEHLFVLIRIGMDPHSFSKLDPDPHKVYADPKRAPALQNGGI
jgi:hypothetical protein